MTLFSKWISLLVAILLFGACEKTKLITQGCKNELAKNFEAEVEESCCCDYDVSEIIDDIEGTYEFKDYCQHFNYEYKTRISRDPDSETQVQIENFSVYNQSFMGKFSDGEFLIDKTFYVGGCKFAFKGSLRKEDGKLLLESSNEVLEGICNNLSDLKCTAIAD